MERLREQYNKEIVPHLTQKFGFKNKMTVPQIQKVVINVGVGKISKDQKAIDSIIQDLRQISGQQPVKNISRKSIAGFKLREGQLVGLSVTLRGDRMYSFVDKLINIALPRVRDFRGVKSSGFDGRGNYHLGLKEHLVFPEIASDSLDHVFGMEISIVTNSGSDETARELLRAYKFPFTNES